MVMSYDTIWQQPREHRCVYFGYVQTIPKDNGGEINHRGDEFPNYLRTIPVCNTI